MQSPASTVTPSRTVVTSFNPRGNVAASAADEMDAFELGDWVMCVTSRPEHWIGCALSNGEIQVYDPERLHSRQVYRMAQKNGRKAIITDLVCDSSPSKPHTLLATASDGSVTLFDVRQSAPAQQWRLPRQDEEALSASMGYDGTLVAVGSSCAKVHFYDARTAAVLGAYVQAHKNEVTQVRFQPSPTGTSQVLLSAGEDGLACVWDTSQPSEETALLNLLAVQSPIRRAGFFGASLDALYFVTGSESLQLWGLGDTSCRKDFGLGLRQALGHVTQQAPLQGNNSQTGSLDFQYLVDCHWDVNRQELSLLAGTSDGSAATFRVRENTMDLIHRIRGGHRGIIRDWTTLSDSSFVTAGEDARVCEWSRPSAPISVAVTPSRPSLKRTMYTNDGGPIRRQRARLSTSPC